MAPIGAMTRPWRAMEGTRVTERGGGGGGGGEGDADNNWTLTLDGESTHEDTVNLSYLGWGMEGYEEGKMPTLAVLLRSFF
jgi:hypothetical protein